MTAALEASGLKRAREPGTEIAEFEPKPANLAQRKQQPYPENSETAVRASKEGRHDTVRVKWGLVVKNDDVRAFRLELTAMKTKFVGNGQEVKIVFYCAWKRKARGMVVVEFADGQDIQRCNLHSECFLIIDCPLRRL